MSFRLVSWNVHQIDAPWRELAADKALDIALLQEAKRPPAGIDCDVIPMRDAEWKIRGYERAFCTAVARLSDRVTMAPRPMADLHDAGRGAMAVSRAGTLTAVDVTSDGEVFTCISAYSLWETVAAGTKQPWIISDASAHRILSDVSTLIASKSGHRIILAGDFNILRGYGEEGIEYWAKRYRTVFDRAEALGLRCIGPSSPNGRQADPWPAELPRDSKNVPTYRSTRQTTATASRQLDFVFVSESIADRVTARAMNEVAEWGPSDHCRILIDVASNGAV